MLAILILWLLGEMARNADQPKMGISQPPPPLPGNVGRDIWRWEAMRRHEDANERGPRSVGLAQRRGAVAVPRLGRISSSMADG